MHIRHFAAAAVAAVLLAGCSTVQEAAAPAPDSTGARHFAGMGHYHRAITTDSAEAQRWFDQGMQLLYGFNHDEAIRSFKEAAARDPGAAMPWWGVAYAHGININDREMNDQRNREAIAAVKAAQARIDGASPAEVVLIKAVAARYAWPAPKDRTRLDLAYADAMERAWKAHPDDPDIGALYAEALMDTQPWDYWTPEGEPKGRILDAIAALERVMTIAPNHPGANHFYIHAVEASQDPDRAVAAAERLQGLVPGAGHLVHMPSHIYIRVGRYADAADSNKDAIEADKAYFEVAPPPGFYNLYFAHNLHFLAYASMMEGRYEDAISAARELESRIPDQFVRENAALVEGLMTTSLHVLVRFGKWEEILDEPEAPDYRLMSRAVRHYARAIAYSALGRPEEARLAQYEFEEAVAKVPQDWMQFNNALHDVLPIAQAMLEGEILYREGRLDEAFASLRKGIEAEEALVYDEPPGWMLPVRHALGALLMGAERYAEAERVYREDLKKNRDNGWALLGLQQSLRAQGKSAQADALSVRLALAWPRPDVRPTSSCYCEPGAAR